jgi:iron complex outermembrane receptor protein
MDQRFIFGVEYQNHERVDYFLRYGQTVTFDRNVPFLLWSLYAQDEYQLSEHIAVTGGLRYDQYSALSGTFSPRLAVNWNAFKGNTMKFLAGRAFRTPNFYELNYEDLPGGYKRNASLEAEIMTTWEIAMEQRITESMQTSFSVYRYDLKNLIDPIIDPADSMIFFYNKSKTTALGIECEIQAQPYRSLDVYFLFSYQRAEDLNTAKILTNSPSWLGRAGVSYMVTPWITASLEGSYDSERRTIFESTTPSYALMNTKFIVHAPNDNISLSLGIRNVLDTRYYVPGGFEHIQHMLPQKGREWFCKLMYSL